MFPFFRCIGSPNRFLAFEQSSKTLRLFIFKDEYLYKSILFLTYWQIPCVLKARRLFYDKYSTFLNPGLSKLQQGLIGNKVAQKKMNLTFHFMNKVIVPVKCLIPKRFLVFPGISCDLSCFRLSWSNWLKPQHKTTNRSKVDLKTRNIQHHERTSNIFVRKCCLLQWETVGSFQCY